MTDLIVILRFIDEFGIPAFQKLVTITTQTTPVTQEQWDEVFTLASKSYDDYVKGTASPTPPTTS